ncbi:MAG: leucine-rich repeat domain-containing protein [Paludibacteraceae bacterium]|nr:leucine-rich repeat domain-containing protein [Paludibacteraceae bacterium]
MRKTVLTLVACLLTCSLTIPATVSYGGNTYNITHIEHHAFYGCTNLQQVTIDADEITLNRYAFSHCPYLAQVTFNSSTVTLAGEYIFSNDGRLATVQFSQLDATQCYFSSATGAFMDCTGLQQIVLPRLTEELPDYFFLRCSALREVHFGMPHQAYRTIKKFGNEVFANCTNLAKVYLHGWSSVAPTLTATSFKDMPSTTKFIMPCTYSSVIIGARGYWANVTIEEEWDKEFYVVSADENMGSVVIVKAPDCSDMTATIAAYPNEKYSFYQWSDGSTENPRNWTEVTENVNIAAVFTQGEHGCNKDGIFPYMFSAFADNESFGSVDTKIPTCDDPSARAYARPNTGYEFVRWSDGDRNATRNVTVTGDTYLQALFQDPADPISEGVEEIQAATTRSTKLLHDGHLFILRPDGTVFNAQGARVK